MLKVTVIEYCEMNDAYTVLIHDSMNDSEQVSTLPAVILPYVAATTCSECEDLPFDLVGKEFKMTCFYLD